ncbi:DUF6915 family protein [Phaeobacter piscinae]|nr:hypothetical protein [Phaeobacter piscinae]
MPSNTGRDDLRLPARLIEQGDLSEAQLETIIMAHDTHVFGLTLTNSAGRDIPVRWIGEQHVREDCQGRIPSMADWLRRIQPEPWMANGHIDRHVGDEPCGDPRAAWASEVVAGRTVLGLKDWMAARAMQATQGA